MIDVRRPDYGNSPAAPGRARFDYARSDPERAPVVSIVTPFHNPGAVFLETVTSVLRQSLPYWEWLVVDDASGDPHSLALLADLERREPRVRVIRSETNLGPGGARNLGFAQARAELVMQLDADDLLEPTYLEKAAWFLATQPQYACVKSHSVGFGASEYLWSGGFHRGPEFLERNPNTLASMVRREAHRAVGGYDATLRDGLEDWEFWLRLANAGLWGGTIPEHLDWYRRRDDHHLKWSEWDGGPREREFGERLRRRYPGLTRERFPRVAPSPALPLEAVRRAPPFESPLAKSKRRLLMIVPWFQIGGADKFNLRLIQQCKRLGWEVTVVATLPAPQDWLHPFAAETPDVFVLDRFLPSREQPAFLRYLIDSRDPDVVLVTNSELGYQLLPYLRRSCPRPAYVDYCHIEEDYWKGGGYPRYAVGCQDQLDLNVVASRHLEEWMVARGAQPERIEVCYINESTSEFRPDAAIRAARRAKVGAGPDTPILLFAGRLCPQKQPHVFGRVMAELAARKLNFLALVVGDGEDRPWLEQFVQSRGLSRQVRLLGARSNEETRDWMAASDVFFLPSRWEGIALSIYEAMAMELAVVGADVGGQRELVTPETGLLLPPGTEAQQVQGYAAALEGLLRDPEHRSRMGKAARRRIAEHFELDAMGERMVALFERARALRQEAPRPEVPERLAHELADRAVDQARLERELALTRAQGLEGIPTDPLMVLEELTRIQASRSFQLISQAKRSLPYRLIARYRWGDAWTEDEPVEPPATRLARIKNSRSFRTVERLKASAPFRWYAARRNEAAEGP